MHLHVSFQDVQNMTRIGVNTFLYNQSASTEEKVALKYGKIFSINWVFKKTKNNKIRQNRIFKTITLYQINYFISRCRQ